MTDGGSSVVSITEYTGVLRRWQRVILLVTVVGAVLGTVALFGRSGEYRARAEVQVRPIVSRSDDPILDTSRQINAETEEAIAGSQRVAERALSARAAAEAGRMVDIAPAPLSAQPVAAPLDCPFIRAVRAPCPPRVTRRRTAPGGLVIPCCLSRACARAARWPSP